MEQTIEAIEAKIASLKEHAREYRRLAAEHRMADNLLIANKLLETAGDCDDKVVELEWLLEESRK